MEYIYSLVASLLGVGLGFLIGRLSGKATAIAAETENRLGREARAKLEEEMAALKKEQGALTQKFQEDFKNIANAVLKDSLQTVTTTAQTNLGTLLNPLQQKLGEFQGRLEQNIQQQRSDSGALKEQIRLLTDLNQSVGADTKRLTDVLRGDVKQQGNWGELKLERLLEAAGLKEGLEYAMQVSLKAADEETKRRQPDAVIYLPQGRHVVVDAKVSLVHFEKSFAEGADRTALLKLHIESIRTHIKGLAERDYMKLTGLNSPDFVFLFIPIEAAFVEAMNVEPGLYDDAFRKKVILLAPSTLLAALKLVHHIWRQEEQTKNAEEIARQGAALYDKFAGFVEDMQKLDKKLGEARDSYDDAFKKLKGGKGNLLTSAEKLRELGIQPKKQLPPGEE